MRFIATLFLGMALLIAGGTLAQEAGTGWLGAAVQDLTKEEADALGWDAPHGAKVVKFDEGSPTAKELAAGDIILSVDKQEIDGKAEFEAVLATKAPGAVVKLRLLRGGKEKTVSVTISDRPAAPSVAEAGPLPMLDTGGHMGLIGDIAFTPDGKQLVSASNDKTIRVWDLATGKTVRTIRGESAPGNPGKIYAMALSPDGKWLAAGGLLAGEDIQDKTAVRLYDFPTGKLVALLRGHENVIYDLAFSPDGRQLISGSGDFTALLWDVETRQLQHRLLGHDNDIYAVGFTPDGQRAVTGSDDHDLRLWRVADGGEIAHMTGHGDQVVDLAVAPDGTIVSGDYSGEIRLWDGKSGAFRKVLARQKTGIGKLSFSPDGKTLLSTCGGGNISCSTRPQTVYDVASGREIAAYRGHDNTVHATIISPDGRWAATGGGANNEIHLWNLRTGDRRLGHDGQPLTLAGHGRPVWAVGFSEDGKGIGWGNSGGWNNVKDRGPIEHILALPLAANVLPRPRPIKSEEAGGFRRAAASQGEWSLEHRKGGNYGFDAILDIKRNGTVVTSIERGPTDGYQHRSYTFTRDGETIVAGGANGNLTAYDRAGRRLGDFIGHEGDVWAVSPSPDGRYLVSGADDQTVRLWNLKTRELLITLFQGADGEWVMWTPQGYYDASGPGAELIGWQINHGVEKEAEYVTAAQLRKSLNRPDIVARAIQLASAEAAVKEAYGTNFKLADLLARPVPRFRIVSPAANAALGGGSTEMEIALEATPDPVKLIRIQVNGRQIAEHLPKQGGGFTPGALKFAVPLTKGRNTIRLTTVNESGETPTDVIVTHEGDGDLDKRGTLYILAIGVDKYPNIPGQDLRFSGADATAFAEAMEKRVGPLHERVVKRVLVNGPDPADAPTAANVLNALGTLHQTRETDTVVVFVAGHGVNEGPNYRFLPTDSARQAGGNFLPASVVPWFAFQEAIESAKGRRILFLDTCHSGNSYNQRLSNDSYQANIIVYSAARWDQFSWERGDFPGGGHGLFTYAAVEGIEGKAAKSEDGGRVTTLALRDFLAARVTELAKEMKQEQEPQYFRGRDAENYLLTAGR